MGKKTISAKAILVDLRAGLSDRELLKKYQLSEMSLQKVFRKLTELGVLTEAELGSRKAYESNGLSSARETRSLQDESPPDNNEIGTKVENVAEQIDPPKAERSITVARPIYDRIRSDSLSIANKLLKKPSRKTLWTLIALIACCLIVIAVGLETRRLAEQNLNSIIRKELVSTQFPFLITYSGLSVSPFLARATIANITAMDSDGKLFRIDVKDVNLSFSFADFFAMAFLNEANCGFLQIDCTKPKIELMGQPGTNPLINNIQLEKFSVSKSQHKTAFELLIQGFSGNLSEELKNHINASEISRFSDSSHHSFSIKEFRLGLEMKPAAELLVICKLDSEVACLSFCGDLSLNMDNIYATRIVSSELSIERLIDNLNFELMKMEKSIGKNFQRQGENIVFHFIGTISSPEIKGLTIQDLEKLPYNWSQELAIRNRNVLLKSLVDCAASGRAEDIVSILEKGANLNMADTTGRVALVQAAASGNADIVKLLMERGANVRIKDGRGISALMAASATGRKEITEFLMNVDSNFKEALVFACDANHLEIVKLFLSKPLGVDFTGFLLRALSRDQLQIADLFLQKGADANKALKWSINASKPTACEHLLKNGINCEVRDSLGHTPLFEAVKNNNVATTKLLLNYGAKCDVHDLVRWTPLFIAVENNNLEIAKLLLQYGADVNQVDNRGETPIMKAQKHSNRSELIDLLRQYEGINQD